MPASVERPIITSDATQSRADATVAEIAASLRSFMTMVREVQKNTFRLRSQDLVAAR
jgi:hypothetical protein